MSAQRAGGDPAATDDVTVTDNTAPVTRLTGNACASSGTRASSVTSPVNMGGTAMGVK